jgi:hypothetical protein
LLANNAQELSDVFGVIVRVISGYLIKKSGFTQKTGKTGAVTLIQRFGSALNLNIHFHMLFLDGSYGLDEEGDLLGFTKVSSPSSKEMRVAAAWEQ